LVRKKGARLKKMLGKLWDDVVAGPQPESGLEKLRKATTSRPLVIEKGGYQLEYQ
jgi:hypothetical protein